MKQIKLTNERKNEIIQKLSEAFNEACKSISESTSSISLKIEPITVKEKPLVYFTPMAFSKMLLLVKENGKEVGWHGTAERYGENDYIVTDIVVYPQVVTSANIDTDDKEFDNWLWELPAETVNHLRFHGHSHVNMGVSPSGTDLKHREDLITQLGDDDFYIFMIINKNHLTSFEIYDSRKNTIYETDEIEYDVLFEDGAKMSKFLDDAKEKVSEQKYTSYITPTSNIKDKNDKEDTAKENTAKKTTNKISYGCGLDAATPVDYDDYPISPYYSGYGYWKGKGYWED